VAGQYGGVFEKTIAGAVNSQYLLFIESGRIEWRGRTAGSGYTTVIGPVLALGSWSHIVGSYDGATLRLYVNGAAAGAAAVGTLASGSGPAFIGHLGAEGGSPGIYPFSGSIDEVALYGSALSASRVLAHFTNAQTNVTTARVSIEVRPTAGGTLTNSAQLSATEADPEQREQQREPERERERRTTDLALSAAPQPATIDMNSTVTTRSRPPTAVRSGRRPSCLRTRSPPTRRCSPPPARRAAAAPAPGA
jgi:hypothetical protein